MPLPPLWSTFPPETHRHLIHLWSDLLARQLPARQRLRPKGAHNDFRRQDPVSPPKSESSGLPSPVHAQTGINQSGEHTPPVSAKSDLMGIGHLANLTGATIVCPRCSKPNEIRPSRDLISQVKSRFSQTQCPIWLWPDLAERAQQLGWPAAQIQTIDEDLGLSGASSRRRTGFQRLVASISLGEVGLVLVTEVSRLSRLNSD
jgi:Resolvase, N terminal domain